MCLGEHILRGMKSYLIGIGLCKEVEDTVNIVSSKVQIPRTTFHYLPINLKACHFFEN